MEAERRSGRQLDTMRITMLASIASQRFSKVACMYKRHCGEAASAKRLSAATFVRRQRLVPMCAAYDDRSQYFSRHQEARNIQRCELSVQLQRCGFVECTVVDTVTPFVEGPHIHANMVQVGVNVAKPIIEMIVRPASLYGSR